MLAFAFLRSTEMNMRHKIWKLGGKARLKKCSGAQTFEEKAKFIEIKPYHPNLTVFTVKEKSTIILLIVGNTTSILS